MSAKPQKRLVSKGRYAWLMTGRAILISLSLLCFLSGLCFVCLSVLAAYFNPMYGSLQAAYSWRPAAILATTSGLICVAHFSWRSICLKQQNRSSQ